MFEVFYMQYCIPVNPFVKALLLKYNKLRKLRRHDEAIY